MSPRLREIAVNALVLLGATAVTLAGVEIVPRAPHPPRSGPRQKGAEQVQRPRRRDLLQGPPGPGPWAGARARGSSSPITPNTPRLQEMLRHFAEEASIDFVDTADLTRRADLSLWLLGDGHLSAAGAHRFAERAAAYGAAHPRSLERTIEGGISGR